MLSSSLVVVGYGALFFCFLNEFLLASVGNLACGSDNGQAFGATKSSFDVCVKIGVCYFK